MPSSLGLVKQAAPGLHAILSALMFLPETRIAFAMLILIAAAALGCSSPPRLAADLVVTRANIWTGNPAQPSAAAFAVIGDRIVDVGAVDEIDRWRSTSTTVVDAEGRRLVPGFNDAHVRLFDGGIDLDNVDLKDAGTAAEFARRINERAKAKPGEWILGGHWDERRWTPAALPTRASIDDITNSSPVFVVRYDGRMALANAAALGRAGITERTPDPPGGALVRDANGFPTGVLQDAAMDIVARVVPATTPAQRQHAVKRALEQAESLGITSVQDIGATYEDIGVYADLANRGELTVRVYAVAVESGWYDQAKLGVHRAFGSPWLRIGAVRARLDPARDADETRTRLMAADHAGLQLSVAAIGDGPTSAVLDLLVDIAQANGGRDRRFRLDGSRIAPADADRLASLNGVALLQPGLLDVTANALIDKGVHVSLGSGWPSAPLNPMVTLDAAISRGVTVAQALAALTIGSAFAEFQEGEKGTIERGKLADVAILSDDVLAIPASRIRDVRVLTTIAGGKIVHQRKP
jgi:predicted amidohydrolase YtcJ